MASSMIGRIFLVTGATDGIGKHTATKLAKLGATVLLHGRSRRRLDQAVKDIKEQTKNEHLDTFVADFSSLAQVRKLSEDIHQRYDHLDVLINNAGVLSLTREESTDGYELTFAVNVLAPFLLTSLLLDLVKKGTYSRIINVSSISQDDEINFDDLQFTMTMYGRGGKAYALSKLCDVMFTYDMAELFSETGITVNCLDPGTVNTKMLIPTWGACGIEVEDADNEYELATNPAYNGITGKYFINGKDRRSSSISYDNNVRKRLWDILVDMTSANF